MSLAADIDNILRKLDQRLVCTEVVVEAVKMLIHLHCRERGVVLDPVDLHAYIARQFARYQARQIGRARLLGNLDAARELPRVVA